MTEPILTQENLKAIAVLATATMRVLGPDATAVVRLQAVLRDRSRASYDAAQRAFDGLGADMRRRIAESAPGIARRQFRNTSLPGLLNILTRTAKVQR